MSPTLQAFGIDKLSVSERLSLMDEIWDSIVADEKQLDIPDWHKEELRRRLEALRDNPQAASSWEDAKRRLLENP